MTFTINRTTLLNALNICGKAVSGSPIYPLLGSFLFEITGTQATITANNMETMISTKVDLTGGCEAIIAIPSVRLLSLLRDLPDQPLIFTIDGTTLTVKANSGKYSMPIEPGIDFNKLTNAKGTKLKLSAEILKTGFDKTIFAVADEKIPNCAAVYVELNKSEITFTGCNHHVLSTVSFPVKTKEIAQLMIMPKSAAMLISLIDGEVDINIADNSISFTFGNTTLTSILSAETYPDYRRVVGLENNKTAEINRLELLGAIRRATSFSNKETFLLKLDFNGHLTLTGEDTNFGEQAQETVETTYAGEPIIIGSSGKYMLDVLSRIESPNVYLWMDSPTRSINIRSEFVEKEECKNMALIMPMMIK